MLRKAHCFVPFLVSRVGDGERLPRLVFVVVVAVVLVSDPPLELPEREVCRPLQLRPASMSDSLEEDGEGEDLNFGRHGPGIADVGDMSDGELFEAILTRQQWTSELG